MSPEVCKMSGVLYFHSSMLCPSSGADIDALFRTCLVLILEALHGDSLSSVHSWH